MHVFNLVSRFTPDKCQLDLEKVKSQIMWGMCLCGGSEHSTRRKNTVASLCVTNGTGAEILANVIYNYVCYR